MTKKSISMVVAYDLNRGIGAANDLLWLRDLPADLQHFRERTMGGTVIMGRKTFDSIGKPLAGRENIVVSHHAAEPDGVKVCSSLAEAYEAAQSQIYVIGGGTIFEQALPDTQTVYATEVQAEFPAASVFFPAFDDDWREVSREHHGADEKNKYPYDFVVYQRG